MENTTNGLSRKIGNTTFIVSLKQSEVAKKTLDEKIRDLCAKEIMAEDFADSGYPEAS
jgi:uncharacterized protein YaaQ